MDAEVWKASKRGFPFNIPLKLILLLSLGIPTVLAGLLLDLNNKTIRDICLITSVLSVLGYLVADKLID